MNTASPLRNHRPLPVRLARNRGVLAPRPCRGYTLPEFAKQLDAGELDRRVSWWVFQVSDGVWQASHGRDKASLVLGQRDLQPRRFRSCNAAMNALREWLGTTVFTVEALPDGQLVGSRGGRDAACEAEEGVDAVEE